MTPITEKLDRLAEFQAQRDLLDMQKRDLLDTVKVPDEIIAAQNDANKRRSSIDAALFLAQKEINAQCRAVVAEIVEPELPAEYIKAMAAYHAQVEDANSQASYRAEIENKRAVEAKAKIDAELQAKTAQVYASLNIRKSEIEAEFGEKARAVDANIAALTEEIKRDTAAHGASVKGKVFHAIYVKGRVSWDTDKLDGMMALIPQLREARKEGAPSVSIRRI